MSKLLDYTIETFPGKEEFYYLLRGEWTRGEGYKIAFSKKGEPEKVYFYSTMIPTKTGTLERFAVISAITGTIISKSALYPRDLLHLLREDEFVFDVFEKILERCGYDLKKLIAIETDLKTWITLNYGSPVE